MDSVTNTICNAGISVINIVNANFVAVIINTNINGPAIGIGK